MNIKHNQKIIAERILLADTLYSRLIGLMFGEKPPQNTNGLMLDPCRSIHTCFMRYSLDVVFLNSNNQIIKIVRNFRPWRISWIYFSATKTLELPSGKLPMDLKKGDFLEVEHV